ncbi:MAG: Ig-like domain-containing protein, partial [Ferruginibacter sp.]
TGCGSPLSSFSPLTVNPNVNPGTVSGTSPLCIGATANYNSNGDAGGTWSSTSPLVASVNAAGLVTALTAGSTNITYTLNTGCGSPLSSFSPLTVNPNANTGTVSGASPVCINNTTTYSSDGTGGGTWSSTNTAVATVDAAGVVTTLSSGTSDIRYTISTGCAAFSFKTITVNPFTSLAGTAGGGQVCSSANVLAGGSSFSDGSCNLIAKVVPSGASPVSGNINACVDIENVVHTYHNVPYVQRHYDIVPAVNAANATATLTLYYTQGEFDAFNLARGAYPAMPGGPGDVVGIGNLRITQFHGTGTYPGNYTGLSEYINPIDANIIWNAGSSRWEISFAVTGFSGFYLFTDPVLPLPITLLNFSGRNNGNYNILDWTTSSEQNSSYFNLERSTDGVNYVNAGTISAAGNSNIAKNYNYNDNISAINKNLYYYRLKMVDVTGSIKYSSVVKIRLNSKGFNMEATPNPFADQLRINIETELSENAVISLKDISGRSIQQKESQLRKGNNAVLLSSLGHLPGGVYLLTITTDSQQQTIKVVKQ